MFGEGPPEHFSKGCWNNTVGRYNSKGGWSVVEGKEAKIKKEMKHPGREKREKKKMIFL